jgi:hypothetical protein
VIEAVRVVSRQKSGFRNVTRIPTVSPLLSNDATGHVSVSAELDFIKQIELASSYNCHNKWRCKSIEVLFESFESKPVS